jgi:hypothetical protein
MTSESAPRFGFVIGTGRCGSSLIHEVIARHPDVGFLSNVDDRLGRIVGGRWSSSIYRSLPQSLTRKGGLRLAPSEGYRILDRAVSPMISTPVRDLVAEDATPWLVNRFRRFFEEVAASQRTPVVIHKFTGWPRARFIQEALPSARFVHVVRDGRAVANSLLQMAWWRGYRGPEAWNWGPLPERYAKEWDASGRSFPVLAALQWMILLDAFDDAKKAIPPDRWLDIRFEDFVDAPREHTQKMLGFFGLAWTDAFERNFRHHEFDASRNDAYRRDLRAADLDDIEAVLAERLEGAGYLGTPRERGIR